MCILEKNLKVKYLNKSKPLQSFVPNPIKKAPPIISIIHNIIL